MQETSTVVVRAAIWSHEGRKQRQYRPVPRRAQRRQEKAFRLAGTKILREIGTHCHCIHPLHELYLCISSEATINITQCFGGCRPITNKWLLGDFWTRWPSAADEEWYSPKRPSSTVAVNSSELNTTVSAYFPYRKGSRLAGVLERRDLGWKRKKQW